MFGPHESEPIPPDAIGFEAGGLQKVPLTIWSGGPPPLNATPGGGPDEPTTRLKPPRPAATENPHGPETASHLHWFGNGSCVKIMEAGGKPAGWSLHKIKSIIVTLTYTGVSSIPKKGFATGQVVPNRYDSLLGSRPIATLQKIFDCLHRIETIVQDVTEYFLQGLF